ncbi:MAG: hypothetical protein ACYC8W_10865 [Candidatus Tyrphobacter sp.]
MSDFFHLASLAEQRVVKYGEAWVFQHAGDDIKVVEADVDKLIAELPTIGTELLSQVESALVKVLPPAEAASINMFLSAEETVVVAEIQGLEGQFNSACAYVYTACYNIAAKLRSEADATKSA